jgi:hypothetical protein
MFATRLCLFTLLRLGFASCVSHFLQVLLSGLMDFPIVTIVVHFDGDVA